MSPRFAAALLLLPSLALAQATGAQEPPAPPETSRAAAGTDVAAHAPELPFVAKVMRDDAGLRLMVNGQPMLVVGMIWDYIPIGFNYRYNLFAQPEDVIVAALDREMGLMKRMGVNAIRVYVGIPAKWIRYIHEKYGLYTVLNPVVGRYGVTMGGTYNPNTNYADPATRAFLKEEVRTLVREYKDTPGLLMWLLGNENNYGLSWRSFEIEALPTGERDAAKARYLYSLFGEILREVKKADPTRPVAIANGDVQYIDLIAQECQGLDVFGTNVYRGASARDLFKVVKEKLGVPVMFTEFGADAYDAKAQKESDVVQAKYLLAQWQEIYEQSHGKGRDGSAIGGFIFQWSDGWWKHGQESALDV
ncbi:MAG TPA: glycoside hydrolase family 2 TIM barrel-domain containing protein, partial [Gemmatimonadaceae bacterium]|nr:glycoside hydrolase family 2 TIM barrel-domain containing protein [Gemmatimonadaceae bacterium]